MSGCGHVGHVGHAGRGGQDKCVCRVCRGKHMLMFWTIVALLLVILALLVRPCLR